MPWWSAFEDTYSGREKIYSFLFRSLSFSSLLFFFCEFGFFALLSVPPSAILSASPFHRKTADISMARRPRGWNRVPDFCQLFREGFFGFQRKNWKENTLLRLRRSSREGQSQIFDEGLLEGKDCPLLLTWAVQIYMTSCLLSGSSALLSGVWSVFLSLKRWLSNFSLLGQKCPFFSDPRSPERVTIKTKSQASPPVSSPQKNNEGEKETISFSSGRK